MKIFIFVYSILSISVIIVKLAGIDYLENFLKPLLMPSLVFFYFLSKKHLKSYDFKIILALIFSTLGDVLLMPFFNQFIPGLLGFLIAHIFYISAFLSEDKISILKTSTWKKIVLLLGISTYFTLLILLYPQLHSIALKLAILLYASILLALLFTSILRNPENKVSSSYIVAGAFLFMLSDGMIAINKFLFKLPISALLIMGTYTIAQALLVFGSINKDK